MKCREREALAAITAALELDHVKRGKAGSRASLHLKDVGTPGHASWISGSEESLLINC